MFELREHLTGASFAASYPKYHEPLVRFCYRFCRNWTLANDLAQDTWMTVVEKSSQCEASSAALFSLGCSASRGGSSSRHAASPIGRR